MPTRLHGLLGLALLLLVCSCQPKPRAPALTDGPVFQSDEGFRFLVPEDWTMAARANLPPGPIEKERLLVQYRRLKSGPPATLEVSVAELPESTNLTEYLSGPSFSASRWKPSGEPVPLEAGGVRGTRYRFTPSVGKTDMVKEVTAFRRGGRVYFFTALSPPGDSSAPAQVRRAVESLVWTK
jgi:hypothetical protein